VSQAASQARPAATVIILRDGKQGPEVLLLKRSQQAGFFPNAWVFPGGRVEEDDSRVPRAGKLLPWDSDIDAVGVAAIRECFEESGIWLGSGTPGPELRHQLNNRTAQLSRDQGLCADLHRLRPWAWWITPAGEPKRYDTRFFLAVVTEREWAGVAADEVETTEARWLRPLDALQTEGVALAPPTFRMLEELATFATCADIWASAPTRHLLPVQPRLVRDENLVRILLPGHPEHPQAPTYPGPREIRWAGRQWLSLD
jgi:8-oxo-dGTP pyrophosphatase MutT (NUDIX family)